MSPEVARRFKSASSYVRTLHANHQRASASIITFLGHPAVLNNHPSLREAITLTAAGEQAKGWEKDSWAMSIAHPAWRRHLIDQGRKAVDAGADLIMIDEIQEFLYPLNYGFDSTTLNLFGEYLSSAYTKDRRKRLFGSASVCPNDLKSSLARGSRNAFRQTRPATCLSRTFARFLEEYNFRIKSDLINEIRDYASQKKRSIAVTANIFALGTMRINGRRLNGLHFSDNVDFFTFECVYTVKGRKMPTVPFPRGKWVAWEKLAFAATARRSSVVLDVSTLMRIQDKNIDKYLQILTAEAYANRAAFMIYHVPEYKLKDKWIGSANMASFILDHGQFFGPDYIPHADLALLYIHNAATHKNVDTYLGLAQALAEANVQYEVIFSGDGIYVDDTLSLGTLNKYSLLVLPSSTDLTSSQRRTLREYRRSGGRIVAFNTDKVMREISARDPVSGGVETPADIRRNNSSMDVAEAFHATYDEKLRRDLISQVLKVRRPAILDDSLSNVCAYVYRSSVNGALVAHLVNYNHSFTNDVVEEKADIVLRISKASMTMPNPSFRFYNPSTPHYRSLPVLDGETHWEVIVPRLQVYGIVHISPRSAGNARR
ncbi:MAG: hypothetical protein GF344_19685 [Chitinivibrionales bacterium]|nr:hypothetical protein [Chitinivibrionales bacterium]MBD3358842.1 hypothetical protein [Chitinivibrionales bacterium]